MFPTLFNCHFEVFCDLKVHLFFTLQRSLSDARENSTRLSRTIESLMTSHTELQDAMERLQTDMGQKESELNILRRDKYVFYHLGKEKTYELNLVIRFGFFYFLQIPGFPLKS